MTTNDPKERSATIDQIGLWSPLKTLLILLHVACVWGAEQGKHRQKHSLMQTRMFCQNKD